MGRLPLTGPNPLANLLSETPYLRPAADQVFSRRLSWTPVT